jgi:hypothetical protein
MPTPLQDVAESDSTALWRVQPAGEGVGSHRRCVDGYARAKISRPQRDPTATRGRLQHAHAYRRDQPVAPVIRLLSIAQIVQPGPPELTSAPSFQCCLL